MIRRTTHLTARALGVVVAGLAVLAGFAAWRVANGPVSLDALAPTVALVLASTDPDLVVSIDHTMVVLGQHGTLEVLARGVHLRRRAGDAQLVLPALSLGLSIRAALTGVVAPTRIVLSEPSLHLRRDTDGAFHLGLGDDSPDSDDWADGLLRGITDPPDRHGMLGYLTQVAVRNATFTVDDRALGVVWRADHADATLFRSAAGVYGDVALSALIAGREAEIHGDLRYDTQASRLAVALAFQDLPPTALAAAAPALAPLAALDLPVSGQVHASLDMTRLQVSDTWCDLVLGRGEIRHERLAGGVLPVAGGELRASYDPAAGRIGLGRLLLDLGGPSVALSGTIDGVGPDLLAGARPPALDLALEAEARDVPTDDLPRLWPEQVGRMARSWVVEHVRDGVATQAHVRLRAHVDLPSDGTPSTDVQEFGGTLDYHGLTVDYLPPLPPVRNVDGTATFDRAHFDLVPSSGSALGVSVAGGAVKLSKLDTNDEEIAIDLNLRGPLRDALVALDMKPLQYMRELKLDPARATGSFGAHVVFQFPLIKSLQFRQVEFTADGMLSGAGIERVIFGQDLAAGDFQLRLDRAELRLAGTAKLAGVPVTLNWTQSLKSQDAVRTRYALRGRIDDAARRQLGLDLMPDMLGGPVDVDVAYTVRAQGRAQAVVGLGLNDASLELAKLGWRKPPGTAASGKLTIDLLDDRVTAIRDAVLAGGGIDARAAVAFDPARADATVSRVDIERLIVGETDVAGTVTRQPTGGWRAQLGGLSLDATALVKEVDAANDTQGPPLVIDLKLDRLILGPKREARAVSGEVHGDGLHWQAASLDAGLIGGGKATLRFGEVAHDRSFHLSTDDFGALLRLFDVSDNVAGGQLQIAGQVEDSGTRRIFRGAVDGADYRVVGAPVFARVLSLASFSGIGALLAGDGIPFSRLKGDFAYDEGKLTLANLRAYGGAIGINAGGTADFRDHKIDLSGTLVPAYALNSVLGNIPVLGNLLLGGEGQGLFGANFRIAGPLGEPRVSVNPLSALAPGFLRNLFLFDPGDPSKPAPPARTSEDPARGGG